MQKQSIFHEEIRNFSLFLVLSTFIFIGGKVSINVEAVDIDGFSSSSGCSGSGYSFAGIAQQVCCDFGSIGSILIRDLASCQTGAVYRGGGCATQVGSNNGPNALCFVGGSFSGGAWFNGCGSTKATTSTSVFSRNDAKATCCASTLKPDGIIYTRDYSQGAWVLKTDAAQDMLSQLESLDDAEKENWLKERGAYRRAPAHVVNV